MVAASLTRLTAKDILAIVVVGWLTSTVSHVGQWVVKTRILGEHVHSASWDLPLLAPLGYLTFYVAMAPPLLAANRLLPPRISVPLIPGIVATVSSFAILLHFDRMHLAAILILAAGIGVRSGTALLNFRSVALTKVRVLSKCAAALLILIALEAVTSPSLRRRELRLTRGEVVTTAPDIILLILDTVRAANLSLYGYTRPTTPRLDELAGGAIVFDNAFSVSSWSAPSHASMLTGLWGSQTGADYRSRMHDSLRTLSEALNARGYVNGAFMSNGMFAGRGIGIDRGFARFDDLPFTFAQAMSVTTFGRVGSVQLAIKGLHERKLYRVINAIRNPDARIRRERPLRRSSAGIIERFHSWRKDQRGRQYFAMLNLLDAHYPDRPPERFAKMFSGDRGDIDLYDGAIAYLDSVVYSVVKTIETEGSLDRTLVIVTSDHGEAFGEHNLSGHGNSAYLDVTHVPLMLFGAAITGGHRVSQPVSLRDLAATILDIAGASEVGLPGESLRSAWETGTLSGRSPVIIEASQLPNPPPDNLTRAGPIRSIVDSAWHFIRYGDGREELFAWRSDPGELSNLAATPRGQSEVNRLQAILDKELGVVATPGQPYAPIPGPAQLSGPTTLPTSTRK
ncbi:MAG: sulfatase [Gemmatimonadota bacterium]